MDDVLTVENSRFHSGPDVAVEESNHRHRGLLRARREWPSDRAAEQGDEVASFHA
jgi:hypothetical protein